MPPQLLVSRHRHNHRICQPQGMGLDNHEAPCKSPRAKTNLQDTLEQNLPNTVCPQLPSIRAHVAADTAIALHTRLQTLTSPAHSQVQNASFRRKALYNQPAPRNHRQIPTIRRDTPLNNQAYNRQRMEMLLRIETR